MDTWQYNHSMSIEEFSDSSGFHYYLSWSSSFGDSWEHDIYKQIVSFDDDGNMSTNGPVCYIGDGGNDEAQEPVSIAYNPIDNNFLSVWEDGSGSTIDIRGQIHTADGGIIRGNWIIAGGSDAQHSPSVIYCNGYFVIAYTDEAPPAQHAMKEVIVLDSNTGDLKHHLNLTDELEDHWWPVSATNNQSHSFTIWTDGEGILGSIVRPDSITVTATAPHVYISNISLYNYSVSWLEEINKYVIVASSENGQNIYSCLVDTLGNRTTFNSFQGIFFPGEVALGTHWNENNQNYEIIFPANEHDIGMLSVSSELIFFQGLILGDSVSILNNISWPEDGGVVTQPIKSQNAIDLYTEGNLVLFSFNDDISNNATLLLLNTDDLEITSNSIPTQFTLFQNYPNPFNPSTTFSFSLSNNEKISLSIFDSLGGEVSLILNQWYSSGKHSIDWSPDGLSSGVYFYKLSVKSGSKIGKCIYLK
ncbi:MAG: T9SS type A sorting domain-containing protein [Candidatus Marinimicrobia bacterium]|jgi:hypothetical protein|nr:T9SS type A sorting domain-containing protein [Candidatus Neomarinimicrobiota bacterium]MBT5460084.1 T9SS type A sorting domain-containing protein [Candidatus Neomarinimicrobiota bacterium]